MTLRRKLAYIYICASVFIGPALPLLSMGDHPSGLDCGDPTWGDASLAVRESYFADVSAQIMIAATVMIVSGIVLLVLLWSGMKQGYKKQQIIPIFGIIVMIAGYALVLLLAQSGFC